MGSGDEEAKDEGEGALAEQRWLALAESIDAIVFVTEPGGRMTWANRQLERQTGFRAEDFWFENTENPFLHPDDAARVGAEIGAFLASGMEVSDDILNRFVDKWGSIRSYRSTVSRITWKGAPALLFVVREVSAAESPEAAREAGYRLIVESASDGILKLAADGRVAFSNRCFQELVGLDAVELGRRGFLECVAPAQRAEVAEKIASVARGGAGSSCECELVTRDGGVRYVSIGLTRVAETPSEHLVLAMVRDVTEARRIEAGLRESEKLESLGVLAAGVAHDFNNVVTAILVSAEIAARLVSPGTKLAEAVGEIQGNAQRAAEVTSALLTYVGKTSRRHDHVDLRTVVRDAVPLLRGVVAKEVSLDVSDGEVPAVVVGDAPQLARVLVNLVMNAAEASAGGRGGVRIAVRRLEDARADGRWFPCPPGPGPHASLLVEDRGSGIQPALLDRIFDPFFTTKVAGRGLGLSALLGIVKSHGGVIRVESEPGERTTFEVVLPLAASQSTTEEPAQATATRASRPETEGTILFVDDEPSLRKLGVWLLEEVGFEVVVAENAAAANAAFEAEPDRFRGAVIDYGLPGVRGDALLARLRERRPDLPAILTSGYVKGVVPRELPHVFLEKPYGGEELQEAVRAMVARKPGGTAKPT